MTRLVVAGVDVKQRQLAEMLDDLDLALEDRVAAVGEAQVFRPDAEGPGLAHRFLRNIDVDR